MLAISTNNLVVNVGSTNNVVGHFGSTDSHIGRIGSTDDLFVGYVGSTDKFVRCVGSTDDQKLKKFAVIDSGIESEECVSASESILPDISSEEGVRMCHSGTRESAESWSVGDVFGDDRVTI